MNQDQNTNMDELNSEQQTKEPEIEPLHPEPATPLFLRDSEDKKGDAQDEKDKTEE